MGVSAGGLFCAALCSPGRPMRCAGRGCGTGWLGACPVKLTLSAFGPGSEIRAGFLEGRGSGLKRFPQLVTLPRSIKPVLLKHPGSFLPRPCRLAQGDYGVSWEQATSYWATECGFLEFCCC
jgi:hypothetical protein